MCSSDPPRSFGDGNKACAAAGSHDDHSRGSRGAGVSRFLEGALANYGLENKTCSPKTLAGFPAGQFTNEQYEFTFSLFMDNLINRLLY